MLWLCGDCRLNKRIACEVTKFDLEFETFRTLVWPQFLSSLTRVSHLRTRFAENLPLFVISDFSWDRIPSSVTSLDIRMGLPGFPAFDGHKTPVLANLRSLVLEFNVPKPMILTYLDFATWMPSLERLHFHPREHQTFISPIRLPPALTDLECLVKGIDDAQESWVWPQSLSRLHITMLLTEEISWFSTLPSSLTDLNVKSGWYLPSRFDWSLAHLPKILHFGWTCPDVTAEMVSKLPRGLLTLKCFGVLSQAPIEDVLRALPSGLTHLYIDGKRSLSASETALLPRSLISMPSFERYTIATDTIPLLPPLLTSQVKISESHPYLAFHTGLRELSCLTDESFKVFPPNLKLLLSSGTLSAEHLPHLPASLEVLEVTFCSISDEDWSLLPRRLTRFKSESGSFHLTRSITELFPRTLTSLHLPVVHPDEDYCLDGLPSTLTDLHIHSVQKRLPALVSWDRLPNLSTLYLSTTDDPTKGFFARLFALLPKRLQSLTLKCAPHDSGLQNQDMGLLPRGIYSLSLPQSSALNKACMKYLPPNLLRFRVGERAVKFFQQVSY